METRENTDEKEQSSFSQEHFDEKSREYDRLGDRLRDLEQAIKKEAWETAKTTLDDLMKECDKLSLFQLVSVAGQAHLVLRRFFLTRDEEQHHQSELVRCHLKIAAWLPVPCDIYHSSDKKETGLKKTYFVTATREKISEMKAKANPSPSLHAAFLKQLKEPGRLSGYRVYPE